MFYVVDAAAHFYLLLKSDTTELRREEIERNRMLEEALGAEEAADMVSRITTSVVTYADNDDYIHAVRVLLGDTLERILTN